MLCCIVGRICFVWCNIIFTIIKYYIVFSVGENDNAGDGVSSGRMLEEWSGDSRDGQMFPDTCGIRLFLDPAVVVGQPFVADLLHHVAQQLDLGQQGVDVGLRDLEIGVERDSM